ncbi:hypothetical protein [Paenibacillus eucommiae]|uniref:Uncharacterized protein n=1 Tax=Paenibacillus eucommiae TaxID=1355755 RepID=A0ABS4J2I1_9BACL|nr:hypothetical protein [Paenibacillus eucommiae]MBP1994032.1 hypothetical protein [Paenibacillus eucommiae]
MFRKENEAARHYYGRPDDPQAPATRLPRNDVCIIKERSGCEQGAQMGNVVRLSNFSGDKPSNPSNGTWRADGFLTDKVAP